MLMLNDLGGAKTAQRKAMRDAAARDRKRALGMVDGAESPEEFRAWVPKETGPYFATNCTISLAKAEVNAFFRIAQEAYFLIFTKAAHVPVTAVLDGFSEMLDGAAGGAHGQRWSDLFLVLNADEPQNIPAVPMSIRTTVGASGESEQPPCACREVDAMRKARAEKIM
jgi:hypothetical protein